MARFTLPKDIKFFESISRELVDAVIETPVVLFKLIIGKSKTNIYGESLSKTYYTGVTSNALIERDTTTTTYEGFGPDTTQTVQFKFNKFTLKESGYYPEIGDLIYHNNAYFEIDNIMEDQMIGGQSFNRFSIICSTIMTRISNIQIEERII